MTIISHKHKFIFIRPAKVAGTSIMASLAAHCADGDVVVFGHRGDAYKPDVDHDDIGEVLTRNAGVFAGLPAGRGQRGVHIDPRRIRDAVGADVWDAYCKFTVVRNPWDWLISIYWWKMRDYSNALAQPASLKTRVANMRLRRRLSQMDGGGSKQDLERALRGDWFKGYMARYPDFYFMDGEPYADRYLRYENLQADYDETRQSLGLPSDALPKTKTKVRPKARDYRDYYTDWSREYIADRYRSVIDAFGYRF